MSIVKTGAVTGAILVAAGLGAAYSPVARGQSRDREPLVRALQVLGRDAQIGVTVRDTAPGDKTAGVAIDDVRRDSPAEKAGFKAGDIVIEFDGERVRSAAQFQRLIQETPEERSVSAVVVRGGQRVTLSVTPERSRSFYYDGDFARAMPAVPAPPAPPATPRAARPYIAPALPFESFTLRSGGGRLGIMTEDLTEQLRDYFGVKTGGVLVRSVTDDSAAAQAGVKAGDVIVSINGHSVDRPGDISSELRGDATDFTLDVVRDKKTMTLKGKLEPRDTRARRRMMTMM